MQEPNPRAQSAPSVETRRFTSVVTRDGGGAWTALLLRGVELGGAVGLLVDGSCRVLAASNRFVAEYAGHDGRASGASLASLGVESLLAERIRRAVHEAVASGPVDGLGGRAISISGSASGPSIVLLVAMQERSEEVATGGAVASSSDRRVVRVLLVEDDELVRGQAMRSLDGPELEVRAVASAKAALELVEAGGRFDVLVTDVVMPEMSGPELAEQLAACQPHLGVLFVSGYADGRLVDSGSPDAPRAFLAKPHTPSALRLAVAGLWRELCGARG